MSDAPDDTVDAFHNGKFVLVQPAKGGHRAGMDALVLAAAVPSGFSGRAADFGAGAGAVGFAVMSRCADASVTLVERSEEMADFARRSIAHEANAALATRVELIVADVAQAGRARIRAGLADRAADFVLMNPPFNDARDRATPSTLRQQAHVAGEMLFEDWLRSAAAVVSPSGKIALIARPQSLGEILPALQGRFGGAQIVPIHAAADQPAIRVVLRGTRGSRGAFSLMPPLVLHEGPERRFTERALAINAGEASLFGD